MRRAKSTRSVVTTQRNPGFGLKRAFSQRRSARAKQEEADAEPMRADSQASELRRKRRSAYFETTQRAELHRVKPVEEFDFDALKIDNPHDKSQPSLATTRTKRMLSKFRSLFRA
ncbi:hypothetical protein DOTSEDRAFT_23977 [Dothistroma septosporum NZE10]|uniref:Uncharacterized protein n=1 Tax=Dothistroma septosporum (strain NZE10 / CBS 128990) TaxID=675120 RepID=N1PKI4_DOTSN|nr:hypothetical protein DOTSEDRAFT_23977 [Dothistroma septosporum NZE10]